MPVDRPDSRRAEPLDFLSVIGQGSRTPRGWPSRAGADEYVAAGFPRKVLRTDDYGLARVSPVTSPPTAPTPSPLELAARGRVRRRRHGRGVAQRVPGGARGRRWLPTVPLPRPGSCTTFQVVSRPQ